MRHLIAALTALLLLTTSACLVIFARPLQFALLAATPTPEATLAERQAATDALLNYYAGRAPLLLEVSSREYAHLVDVRTLMITLRLTTALGVAILFGGIAVQLHRRQGSQLSAAIRTGAKINAFALGGLLVILAVAFPQIFDVFHRLVFHNDLWLLEPGSRLLRLYPQAYFAAAAVAIVSLDLVLAAAAALILRPRPTLQSP